MLRIPEPRIIGCGVMCWDHPPAESENALISPKARFGQRRPRLMSLEMFTGVVDDLCELGTRRIEILGRGEPLMHPRLWTCCATPEAGRA